MKKMKKLIALSAVMTLFAGQVQSQDVPYYDESGAAYEESGNASYLSAALPVGVVVLAAIIIATTNNHHHHHSSSSSCSRSSSSSHSGHFGNYTSGCFQ